jgi:hypothetical protein
VEKVFCLRFPDREFKFAGAEKGKEHEKEKRTFAAAYADRSFGSGWLKHGSDVSQ